MTLIDLYYLTICEIFTANGTDVWKMCLELENISTCTSGSRLCWIQLTWYTLNIGIVSGLIRRNRFVLMLFSNVWWGLSRTDRSQWKVYILSLFIYHRRKLQCTVYYTSREVSIDWIKWLRQHWNELNHPPNFTLCLSHNLMRGYN